VIALVFETHSTSVDNEAGLASGQFDAGLSGLGEKQAVQLGARYRTEHFDAIFCSDLQRSYRTAEIAFEERGFPIVRDARLREIDFGDMTRRPSREIEPARMVYVKDPYPGGESYSQVAERVSNWLSGLLQIYDGRRAMLIAHRAQFFSLEHLVNKRPLCDVLSTPWKWQHGWTYKLQA
jgi:broad specificity phosphatase PhoE